MCVCVSCVCACVCVLVSTFSTEQRNIEMKKNIAVRKIEKNKCESLDPHGKESGKLS